MFSRTQLGLPLSHVRVVAPDVGGAFGMKLSAYPDEMAVAAIAVLLGRPVKFVADRLESFVSDGHAREAKVRGRLAVDAGGKLLAMEVTAVSGFGAYPNYPRGSVGEGLQTIHLSAAAYRLPNFRGQVRGYFQNKPPSGVLRGVGHPMATHRHRTASRSRRAKTQHRSCRAAAAQLRGGRQAGREVGRRHRARASFRSSAAMTGCWR